MLENVCVQRTVGGGEYMQASLFSAVFKCSLLSCCSACHPSPSDHGRTHRRTLSNQHGWESDFLSLPCSLLRVPDACSPPTSFDAKPPCVAYNDLNGREALSRLSTSDDMMCRRDDETDRKSQSDTV